MSPVCTPVSVMVWGKCELCVNCERVAYLSAYPVCCIPGIHQTSIASSPSTLHTVCNEYATSIQYAGMQQYSVCNSMPHPSAPELQLSPRYWNSPGDLQRALQGRRGFVCTESYRKKTPGGALSYRKTCLLRSTSTRKASSMTATRV